MGAGSDRRWVMWGGACKEGGAYGAGLDKGRTCEAGPGNRVGAGAGGAWHGVEPCGGGAWGTAQGVSGWDPGSPHRMCREEDLGSSGVPGSEGSGDTTAGLEGGGEKLKEALT